MPIALCVGQGLLESSDEQIVLYWCALWPSDAMDPTTIWVPICVCLLTKRPLDASSDHGYGPVCLRRPDGTHCSFELACGLEGIWIDLIRGDAHEVAQELSNPLVRAAIVQSTVVRSHGPCVHIVDFGPP